MVQTGIGVSLKLTASEAAREAAAGALGDGGRHPPEVAIALATSAWGSEIEALIDALRLELEVPALIGGSVEALWGRGCGAGNNPALAVLTLAGVEADAVLLSRLSGQEAEASDELLAHLGDPLAVDDLTLLVADPDAVALAPLLAGFAESSCEASRRGILGFGASALPGGGARVWNAHETSRAGVVCLRVRGLGVHQDVARSCRPLGKAFEVTRARGNWILGLEGRPALDVYRELVSELGLDRASDGLRHLSALVLPSPPGSDWTETNIVGLDPARGALSIPRAISSGARVGFGLRDEIAARDNLQELVARSVPGQAGFGLFVSGSIRGEALFGGLESEARRFAAAFPGLPFLGLHTACRIGAPSPESPGPCVLSHEGLLVLAGS